MNESSGYKCETEAWEWKEEEDNMGREKDATRLSCG